MRSSTVGCVVAVFLACAIGSVSAFHPPEGMEFLENVEIGTGGGHPIHADILMPKLPPKDPMPAVLMIHGGGWSGGTYKGYHPGWLVEKGYFVATIDYRLSGEVCWPAQIEDCKLAVRWLRANAAKYHVDPARIGCMGHSAGGHLVACLGTLGNCAALEGKGGYEGVSSCVQAVVDESGPSDFTPAARPPGLKDYKDPPGLVKLFGGGSGQRSEAWRQGSPAQNVGIDTPPFLIVHGELDKLVPISQSERLLEALKKAGVSAELIRVKNGGHGLGADKGGTQPAEPDSKTIQAAILSFFDRQLKK